MISIGLGTSEPLLCKTVEDAEAQARTWRKERAYDVVVLVRIGHGFTRSYLVREDGSIEPFECDIKRSFAAS